MNMHVSIANGLFDQRAADRRLELDKLRLHIAVSAPYDAAELSRRIARPKAAIHEDLTGLMSEGDVIFHEGALRTSGAARIIDAALPTQLEEVHNQVLAEIESGISPRRATLIAMAESGCTAELLLTELVRTVGNHPDDAAAIGALALIARARGHSDDEVRLLGAGDAAIRGRTEEVLSTTDPLLTATDLAIRAQAGVLAAGALIQSNRLERALTLYRHVGDDHIGHNAAWAVLAAIGQGDLESARYWRRTLGDESLTSYESGLADLVDGILASVLGDGEGSLEFLARSVSALAPLGADILLPETPAALAALVSIGRGDPGAAEVILRRALKANLGGRTGQKRHVLLSAWSLMVQGRLDEAEERINQLPPVDELCDRDRLLYLSLQCGMARRRTDTTTMREAWHELRGHTFGLSITLFDLLPLGEMMVVAARFRDTTRIQELVSRAQTLTAALGRPIVWTAPFHWSGVQSAFQANDPAALIPHANALAAAKHVSTYASTLAQAGQTWLEVLRHEADFASVDASARVLAEHGQVWDAARLAGQAALQHPEREGATSLMQLAREISRGHPSVGQPKRKVATLTSREVEVAHLVLEGHGYRAIGEQLFISPKTVEHHVARMRNRLGAVSRADLLEKLHEMISPEK